MSRPRNFPATLTNKFGSVTIYRTRNGMYTSYKIVWQEGPHRKKETRPDELSAVARANEILDDLLKGVPARKEATAEMWSYYQKCEELLGGVPLVRAVEFFLEHSQKTTTLAPLTVSELAESFLQAQRDLGSSPSHIFGLKHTFKKLVAVVRKPISQVHVGDLDAFLATIPNLRSRHNHRIHLVSAWKWAKRKGYLPRDRDTAAELTDHPAFLKKDPEILTISQLKTHLSGLVEKSATDPKAKELIAYSVLGAFSAIRSAEILRMDWDRHIKLDEGVIVLTSDVTKTNRRRVIPMEPVLLKWLASIKSTGRVVSYTDPHKSMKSCKQSTWPNNALRHSGVSYLMGLHSNSAQISDQSGHSVQILESNYKAAVTKAEAKKWFDIHPPRD